MLAAIIGSGANIFITIVVIILAFGIGIGTTDFLKTKDKQDQADPE